MTDSMDAVLILGSDPVPLPRDGLACEPLQLGALFEFCCDITHD